jgi:AraC family transcriptional regulator of arabinose operon
LLTQRGDCVILPPGLPHDYRIAPECREWEFLWTHFLPWPHWMGLLSWPQVHRGIKFLRIDDDTAHERVAGALERMHSLNNSPLQQRELFAMNALEEALLWLNSSNPDLERSHFDSRVRSAMDFICAHIDTSPTLAQIGRACGLSPSRLSHLFRQQVGMAPVEYLEQRRMNRARELLEITALRISEIAAMLGYDSPFYFTRRFTKFTGQSPKQYRAAALGRER